MPEFPHLNLKQKIDGRYQFAGRRIERDPQAQTIANLNNRSGHGTALTASVQSVTQDYQKYLQDRQEQGLPQAFNAEIIPVFLQVDPQDFDIESLKGFGIEIISEEGDGFIIGANADNFSSLASKIEKFVQQDGKFKDQAAKLWQIVQGTQWRVDYILSPELREKYINGIADHEQLTVDISIACYLKMPDRPVRYKVETDEEYAKAKSRFNEKYGLRPDKTMRPQREEETVEHFEERLQRWRRNLRTAQEQRDTLAIERQDQITEFVETLYGGEILSSFIDIDDSFGFKARMSGQSLKDLIRAYPFVFEISESETVEPLEEVVELPDTEEIEILPPSENAPVVCVIDSGLQEEHLLLAPAVIRNYSKSYVPGNLSTADQVRNGGHGTMVAGGILYGNLIPSEGRVELPCFLVNARVLDENCALPQSLYPPELMRRIADDFNGIKLFNLSIASWGPCKTRHMSAWAASIDRLSHEFGIMVVIAAGNIVSSSHNPQRPGVKEHLEAGRPYPDFLLEPSSRVANPAQSLLGLTVGSVCLNNFLDADRQSFGQRHHVSAFSRSGPGLWGCVKPDVVEYGGDFLRERNGFLITQVNSTSTPVVRSGANRTGYAVGTSFAAPKVMHLLARVAANFPDYSPLLFKALLVQSARLPEHVFHNPVPEALRTLGYGIPDATRALDNNPYRITFVTEGKVAAQKANLYSLAIPQAIRRAGADFEVLIEVTLTYTAQPRRTRRRLKSYFGSWLSWESSRLGEDFDLFSSRVLKDMEDPNDDERPLDNQAIRWTISTSPNYGRIVGFKRQDSATQKDWSIVRSNTLPAELSFAVIGHKGWDKDTAQEIPFALVISLEAVARLNDIYVPIEAANRVEVEEAVVVPINR